MTLKEAKRRSIAIWTQLAEKGYRDKGFVTGPARTYVDDSMFGCPLCSWAREERLQLDEDRCDYCPMPPCLDPTSDYVKWSCASARGESTEVMKEHARKVLGHVRSIEC